MQFSFHNKLTITVNDKKYIFYNTILQSLLVKLSTFEKYNQFLAIGDGVPDSNFQSNFKLTNHKNTLNLTQSSCQSDITKGELFSKNSFLVSSEDIPSTHISEVGLSDNSENPTIFNYFTLIDEQNPQGIDISNSNEVLFEVTIYLNINENNNIILTSGKNPFIEFLLGYGMGDIYTFLGSNYSENVRINREPANNKEYYPCNTESKIIDNYFEINFSHSYSNTIIDEIVFVSDNRVFARQNLKELNPVQILDSSLISQNNYVIKLEEDIKEVLTVKNQNTQANENNIHISKYANSFGDKIHFPFSNLFSYETPRFVSKDGDKLFFLLNDSVYAYKNKNFNIESLDCTQISEAYITHIISFNKFVFIVSKLHPFISTYEIKNNRLEKIINNFESSEIFEQFKNLQAIDITQCNNGKILIGILTSNKNALTVYIDYDENSRLILNNFIQNQKEFNYVFALYKNHFCDGQIIYLKEGETSASSRIVTHYADFTENDTYSYLAFALTNNSKRIYTKGRAIISEKKTSPTLSIFYYPQVFEYNLPLLSNEKKNYISPTLDYIIQEFDNKKFDIYNLVGYETPEMFVDNIDSIVNTNDIVDFEFLKDTLLIFVQNSDQIIAYNLNLVKTQIENVSEKNTSYQVTYNKYNKLGSNNNTININLTTRISL